MVLSDTS